jgi:hypothetical protein
MLSYGPTNHESHLSELHFSNDTSGINTSSSEDLNSDDFYHSQTIPVFICIPTKGYESFFRTYIPIFDILIVAVIPFFLLCFTNIGIIIYTMRTNQRMRQHRKRAHRRHQRLTIMLLSVTLAFIGLTCPSVIFICVNKIIYSMRLPTEKKSADINSSANPSEPSNVQLIVDVCEALWYTKHAMNFILYTLSGQDFRREFIKLFTQCFHNRPSILKKLINQSQATNETRLDTSLTEIPIITNRKKSKKQINNNRDKSTVVFINSKTPPATPESVRILLVD